MAGAVNVLYGSALGLTAWGNQLWHQNSSGIQSAIEALDFFGKSLAAGDFNNDGFFDLAIGVPGESLGSVAGAGVLHVLYDSVSGLTAQGNQLWHLDSPGIIGSPDSSDAFGGALVAFAEVDHDPASGDLALPGETFVPQWGGPRVVPICTLSRRRRALFLLKVMSLHRRVQRSYGLL